MPISLHGSSYASSFQKNRWWKKMRKGRRKSLEWISRRLNSLLPTSRHPIRRCTLPASNPQVLVLAVKGRKFRHWLALSVMGMRSVPFRPTVSFSSVLLGRLLYHKSWLTTQKISLLMQRGLRKWRNVLTIKSSKMSAFLRKIDSSWMKRLIHQ